MRGINLSLIGYGEAASTFATAGGWRESTKAFDIDVARASAIKDAGILHCGTRDGAMTEANIALSLVTANQALLAAQQCAEKIETGALWLDMNSVAPETKRAAADAINRAGGRYVDVAIMAPVNPAALKVPLLVSGPDADEAAGKLAELGFSDVAIAGESVGQAACVKMLRSVIIKGIEALSDEMFAAAASAGVAEQVIASLDASQEIIGWKQRVAYNQERMQRHGERRAAEMEEVTKTLRSLGVEPVMSEGTIKRQRNAARMDATKREPT